jgi:hypothetical protein
MKKSIALACLAVIMVASSSPAARQTTLISVPARSPVTDGDVLILREYNKATGVGYGTMPTRYATEVRRRLSAMLDLAIVDAAYSMAPLYLTREAAQAAQAAPPGDRTNVPAVRGAEATFNALSVLGVQPALGRDFAESDVAAGRHLALLTAGAWQRFFGSRQEAIGRVLWQEVRGGVTMPVEIVGILPAGVMTATPELDPGLDALVLAETRFETPPPDDRCFAPIVRLKAGVSLEAAQRGIDAAVTAAQRALGAQDYAGQAARLDTLRRPR